MPAVLRADYVQRADNFGYFASDCALARRVQFAGVIVQHLLAIALTAD